MFASALQELEEVVDELLDDVEKENGVVVVGKENEVRKNYLSNNKVLENENEIVYNLFTDNKCSWKGGYRSINNIVWNVGKKVKHVMITW